MRTRQIVTGTILILAATGALAACGTGQATPKPATTTGSPSATAPVRTPAPPTRPAAPAVSPQEQNAITAAKQYLQTMPFSRKGLIQQLSSTAGDNYPLAVATAAVDSLTVDFDAQATKAAKQYLETMPFSCSDLVRQLSSDAGSGFTTAQATYGAHQAGAC